MLAATTVSDDNVRIEGDSTSDVLLTDPALHTDMDTDEDALISYNTAKEIPFEKILTNFIRTNVEKTLQFKKPFKVIKNAGVHSEKRAAILGFTASRYETMAKDMVALTNHNMGFFEQGTLTDVWLVGRSLNAIENHIENIKADFNAYNSPEKQTL